MTYRTPVTLLLFVSFIAVPAISFAAAPPIFSAGHPQYMAALSVALAQETADAAAAQATGDENFGPEDFGLKSVGILPNSPLYLFKMAGRGLSDVLTTDPTAKIENSIRSAAEKLLEAKALSDQGANASIISSALDRFRKEVETARTRAEAVAKDLGNTDQGKALARTMMDSIIKYEKLIGKIEKDTGGIAVSAATDAKNGAAGTLGAALSLVSTADAPSTLTAVLDAQPGSAFKDFKNLEVLKTVAGQVPASAEPAIRAATERALTNLEDNVSATATGARSAFTDFVRDVGGNEVRHVEIIQDLETRPLSPDARATVLAAKEEALSRAGTRLGTLSPKDGQALVGHLSDGTIADARVANELQKNIPVETLAPVAAVVSSATTNLAKKVEAAATDANEQAKLLTAVEQYHDVRSLSVLDEIAALIPPEQQAAFTALKQKAAAEIQKDITGARDTAQKNALYQALASDHPDDLNTLNTVRGVSGAVVDGIRTATTAQIKARVGVIRDPAQFQKYEDALTATNATDVPATTDLTTFFAAQKTVYGSRDKAEQKITDAEALVKTLSDLTASLPLNLGYGEAGFDQSIRDAARLLNSAEARLANARAALERNDFGGAYGEAQEAAFAAQDGASIARAYKSGTRSTTPVKPVLRDAGAGGGDWLLYNRYEFQKFCISGNGLLVNTLSCSFNDGRTYTVVESDFPINVPVAFRPTEQHIVPPLSEREQETGNVQSLPSLDPTKAGRCAGQERYGCPSGMLCAAPIDTPTAYGSCISKENIEKRTDISCTNSFSGFVYDKATQSCRTDTTVACTNPFVYKTKDACEAGGRSETRPDATAHRWVEHTWKFADGVETSMILSRTDAEYQQFIKNTETVCRLTPKQQFVWRPGAGNDAADNWKNFGVPDCSGQAFAPANCGNNICELGETTASCPKDCAAGKTAGDTYSCPGFAYERIDARGKRYCQLNARRACNANYPQFLYESSYAPSLCPSDVLDNGGLATTTAASSVQAQFVNCGASTSADGCRASASCQWYVPPQGSPYCAPAVRQSWVSHTWRFSDGSTETSSILSRTDREYATFIASVDAQCKLITRTKFSWKSGAGNDAPDNWQNFGVPDCLGAPTQTATNTATSTPASSAPSTTSGSSMQKCFYSRATKNGASMGYTVWCEADYVNCHEGSASGASISLDGVSLGAPSSCESGWTGGSTNSGTSNAGSAIPATPSDLTATLSSDNTVRLSWTDRSSNEEKFKVWRSVNGSWSFLADALLAAGGNGSYIDAHPASGSLVYQVQACNASGCSTDSNTATVWVGSATGTTNTNTTNTSSTNTNTTNTSTSGTSNTTTTSGSSSMQKCFYSNASRNGTPLGFSVWCESDYVNCHEQTASGPALSMTGVSLGGPSSCESGWSSGSTNGGSSYSSGSSDAFNTQSGCSAANGTWSGSYCSCQAGYYYSNGFCTPSGSGSSGGSYTSSCSSTEYWDSATQTCKTMSSGSSSSGSSCGTGLYWNGSACVSSQGSSVWDAFRSWLGGN